MALTEKGLNALGHVKTYFPTGAFSAADLSSACGEKIFAATLNAIVSNGYLNKLGGSPVMYEAIPNLIELLDNMDLTSKNGCNNSNLHTAKKAKNDEFYTRYEDIEAEVMKYRKYFRDKVVYLPCDDPIEKKSEFWSFFVNNFDAFGIKKLIATYYNENGKTYKIWIDRDNSGDGYIDDADAFQEELIGNGDFRSPECTAILNECDIVCTNPPFSMFREFVDWIFTAKKQFLIIGNNNAITYKEIFPLIKDNQMWVGYTANKTRIFRVGEGYTFDDRITKQINDGNYYGKVPAVTWFTNLPNTKRNEEMVLTASYYANPDAYPHYDNYDGINVDRLSQIPKDYEGAMGVPITIIDSYNPEQFEIIKFRKGDDGKDLRFNGKEPYFRVLIRRKK